MPEQRPTSGNNFSAEALAGHAKVAFAVIRQKPLEDAPILVHPPIGTSVRGEAGRGTASTSRLEGPGSPSRTPPNSTAGREGDPGNTEYLPAVGQAAADQILKDWSEFWLPPERNEEPHPLSWQADWQLEPITDQEVARVLKLFPAGTALGWGAFHPRPLRYASPNTVARLAAILSAWERNPVCDELFTMIMVFLPKPGKDAAGKSSGGTPNATSGTRPIGLMSTTGRIWSRVRQNTVQRWEREVDCAAFWGKNSATAAERASYVHNLLTCHARRRGLTSITLFFDIMKFYEMISHDELRTAALHFGFDLGLLRALCCLYRAPRHARWGVSTSAKVRANGTVVAGCSCATGVSKLL